MNGTLIVAMRQFGTGVVISTAIVHVSSALTHFPCEIANRVQLFTHAELFFSNDCIEGIEYEATAGAILIAGLFITFIIEYIAHRWIDRKRHMFEKPQAPGAVTTDPKTQKEASEGTLSETSSSEHYTPKSLALNTAVMEAGIIFHSIRALAILLSLCSMLANNLFLSYWLDARGRCRLWLHHVVHSHRLPPDL